jgi:hypothetical protein
MEITYYIKNTFTDSEIFARSYKTERGYILETGTVFENNIDPVSGIPAFFAESHSCVSDKDLKKYIKSEKITKTIIETYR